MGWTADGGWISYRLPLIRVASGPSTKLRTVPSKVEGRLQPDPMIRLKADTTEIGFSRTLQ